MRIALATAAATAMLAVSVPPSVGAAPGTDDAGYVDSTARCEKPATAVLFGATADSRMAICKASDGTFSYRGVRISDGAKLIVPAEESTDGAFVAENSGIEYMVTKKSLVVSQGREVLREEPMVDFHGAQAAIAPSTPTSPTPLPPPLPAERTAEG
ncbi:hypothetical protein [Mycobacterium sp. ITM-2016-00318]|uniref:hypothetical protein n=1 Tax=Mycobacterium sp. ITM-2016-00318 TaxID=2099693 RepID=UPI000CF9D544|nr:hypothetical protein [Mycobacterium sp. ITM-2016-00318]WNG95716.1 hypothetical protein C6A82_001455 [Mycobacterium sp. ITM-2016-00318]